MFRLLPSLFIVIFFSLASPTNAETHSLEISNFQKKEIIVYITKTGQKYHRGTCGYLSKSKIEVKLKDAVKNGYGACKVCKP